MAHEPMDSNPSTIRNQPVSPLTHAAITRVNDNPVPLPPPALARESAARDRARKRRVKSRRGGEWAWVVVAVAMLGIVIVLSMSVSLLIRTSQERQEVISTAAAVLPTPVDARTTFASVAAGGEQVILSDGRSVALTPWNGTSRFTLLVMGLDRRPGETGLAYRTDTMLLVSLDPTTNTVGILSIPRDLYVEVPGYNQLQRVNTSMVLGELRQPDFGPQLTMQTVQYNLGIRVHDFVAIDFQTFIKFIDAIGGLEIDIPYNISDPLYPDMNYGYDPFYIRAGGQVLDGATALKYARTRHGDSDFQRAQRQQLVLYAIRDQLTSADRLPQLIVQSPSLWAAVQNGIYTGLTLDQIIQLGLFFKDVPAENIHTGVINEAYTVGYTTAQGAQVLVPDRARLGTLMVEVFGQSYSQ
ncbi:MAG: LCP family protein [Anaerolineae bacterium]|nr:LCP family protein [Anaerolineae bacterium]